MFVIETWKGEYEGSGSFPSHHMWLFSSGTQPSFRLEVRWEVELVTFLSTESVSCFPFGGTIRCFCSLKDRETVSSDESVTRGLTVFHLDWSNNGWDSFPNTIHRHAEKDHLPLYFSCLGPSCEQSFVKFKRDVL